MNTYVSVMSLHGGGLVEEAQVYHIGENAVLGGAKRRQGVMSATRFFARAPLLRSNSGLSYTMI